MANNKLADRMNRKHSASTKRAEGNNVPLSSKKSVSENNVNSTKSSNNKPALRHSRKNKNNSSAIIVNKRNDNDYCLENAYENKKPIPNTDKAKVKVSDDRKPVIKKRRTIAEKSGDVLFNDDIVVPKKRNVRDDEMENYKILGTDKEDEAIDVKNADLSELGIDNTKEEKEEKQLKKKRRIRTVITIAVFLAIGYGLFLIYGVSVTDYTYDDNGNIVPITVNVSDIRKKENFKAILEKYREMREMYIDTLNLDYELANNPDGSMSLATQYEGYLEDIAALSIKLDAMTASSEYTQIKSLLLSWIKNDIAVYMQNVSAAISNNDTTKMSNAFQDRTRMYENWNIITSNIVSICKTVKGLDYSDVTEWTPDIEIAKLQAKGGTK